MQSTIECACGKHLDTDAQKPGDRGQCPVCGNVFVFGEPVKTTSIQAEMPPIARPNVTAVPEPRSIEMPSKRGRFDGFFFFGILFGIPLTIFAFVGFCIRPMGGGNDQLDLARTQARGPLTRACDAFRSKNGRWPKDLKELLDRNNKGGPYVENLDALIDPWGSMYQYDAMGPMNNGARPDVWTVFPKTGAKIGNWPTR